MSDLPRVHNRHAPARCHGDALLRAAAIEAGRGEE